MTDLATWWERAIALAIVMIAVTVVVYGTVALIVKMDDVGLHLTKKASQFAQKIGRLLLKGMPWLLKALSFVGTIAMLWVGGGILIHGLHEIGLHNLSDFSHGLQHGVEELTGGLGGFLGWLTYATISAIVGLIAGAVLVFVLHKVLRVGHGAGRIDRISRRDAEIGTKPQRVMPAAKPLSIGCIESLPLRMKVP